MSDWEVESEAPAASDWEVESEAPSARRELPAGVAPAPDAIGAGRGRITGERPQAKTVGEDLYDRARGLWSGESPLDRPTAGRRYDSDPMLNPQYVEKLRAGFAGMPEDRRLPYLRNLAQGGDAQGRAARVLLREVGGENERARQAGLANPELARIMGAQPKPAGGVAGLAQDVPMPDLAPTMGELADDPALATDDRSPERLAQASRQAAGGRVLDAVDRRKPALRRDEDTERRDKLNNKGLSFDDISGAAAAGFANVAGLWEGIKAHYGAMNYRALGQTLADYDAADAGKQPAGGQQDFLLRAYAANDKAGRAQMRQRAIDQMAHDSRFINDAQAAYAKYQKMASELSPDRPKFGDVQSAQGFLNYALQTGIASSPTMAAAMLGAALGGVPGFVVGSVAMGVGDIAGSGLARAGSIHDPSRFTNPDRYDAAAADKGRAVAETMAARVPQTNIAAPLYGAVEMFGPEAVFALRAGVDAVKRSKTVRGALLKGAKEAPGQALKEGGEELAQYAITQGVGVAAGERRAQVTADDVKQGVENFAGGAVSAPGMHAVNVARDVYGARQYQAARQRAERDNTALWERYFAPTHNADGTPKPPTQARADSLGRFDELAAAHGLSPKAARQVRAEAEATPSGDVPGFLARVAAALNRRGLFRKPLEDASAANLGGPQAPDAGRLGPAGAESQDAPESADASGFDVAFESPAGPSVTSALDEAAHAAAASPLNVRGEPTDAQKKAGNYAKGHVRIGGMAVAIENPQGSTRRGVDADGAPWERQMTAHYGYVKGTRAGDSDQSDVFIKAGTPSDYDGPVFVVDQIDPKTGAFDEHKSIIGARSEDEARALYLSNYESGWQGLGAITRLPMDAFKAWVNDGVKRKPLGQLIPVGEAAEMVPVGEATEVADDDAVSAWLGAKEGRAQPVREQALPVGEASEIEPELVEPQAASGEDGAQVEPPGAQPAQPDASAVARKQTRSQRGTQSVVAVHAAPPANGAVGAGDQPGGSGGVVGRDSAVGGRVGGDSITPAPGGATDAVAGAADQPDAALNPPERADVAQPAQGPFSVGQRVDLDGRRYTVEKVGKASVKLREVEGGAARTVMSNGATWKRAVEGAAKPDANHEQPAQAADKPRVFKSRKNAERERDRLGNENKLQKIKGGYILRRKTDAEIAAAAKAGARLRARKFVDTANDTLLQAIAKLGGLAMSVRADTITEGNRNIGGRMLFRRDGAVADEMAMQLYDLGYIPQGEYDSDGGVRWLENAVAAEFAGQREHYSQIGGEERMEAARLAAQGEEPPIDDDPFGPLSDFELDDLDASGYSAAPPEVQAATEAILAEAEALGIDPEQIKEDAARAAEGQSDDEYHAQAQRIARAAITAAREAAAVPEPGAESRGGEDRVAAAGDQGQAEVEDPLLVPQTVEDLRSKAEREAAAEQADKEEQRRLAARDAAETRRKNKAEEDARAERVRKERADAARDDFQLGQEPPSAKVSHDEAAGQGDIFASPPAPVSPRSESAAQSERFEAGKALTKEQRKAVLATLVDVYKAKNAPLELKGQDRDGNDRFGYAHSPDLFEKSDITGAMVRYYVTLPDRRIAHPSELFPDYTQSDIDAALAKQKYDERVEREEQARWTAQAERFGAPTAAEADAAWMRRNGSANGGNPLTDWRTGQKYTLVPMQKDGKFYSVRNDDSALIGRLERGGWVRVPTLRDRVEATRKGAEKPAAQGATEDVGENLRYNRRNVSRGGIGWGDVSNLSDALKVREVVKAKVWPKPDYAAMIDAGMPPRVARAIKQMYDAIGSGPTATTDEALKLYIDTLAKVRAQIDVWAADPEVTGALAAGAERDYQMAAKASKLIDMLWPNQMNAPRYARFGLGTQEGKEARAIGGNKALSAMQFGREDIAKWDKDIEVGWPAARENWERMGYQVMPSSVGLIVDPQRLRAGGEPVAYYVRSARGVFEGKFDTKEAAQERIAAMTRGMAFVVLDKNGRFQGAATTRDKAIERAREMTAPKRKGSDMGSADSGFALGDAQRVGADRRAAGENISSEQLMEGFGFRGVNFGRKGYIGDDLRQAYLNAAWDALHDLADLTGLPAKALSLNGQLGIAFGAQGRGGRAAAHFVPGVNEINLTRDAGAGTLAHEWGHALDHYFAALSGLARDKAPFLSDHADSSNTVRRSEPDPDRPGRLRMVERNRFAAELRPEVLAAFRALHTAMNRRPLTQEMAKERQASQRDKALASLNKWIAHMRKGVKSDEARAEFDALADKLRAGDLGDGYVRVSRAGLLHKTIADMAILLRAKGDKSAGVDLASNWTGLQNQAAHTAFLVATEDFDAGHTPQGETTGSIYEAESALADGAKKGKAYWNTRHEKFARAFETWVSDKLAERALANTFLSDGGRRADDTSAERMPYPRGEERATINRAFDALVAELKTRETERGIEIFEPQADYDGAGEPEQGYSAPYETDLFGNPLPQTAGKARSTRPARAGVRGNVQPESAVPGDTPAPEGDYYAPTVVGVVHERKLGASRITSAQEAAQATRYLYDSAVERFDGIVTDKDGKPLAVIGGFKGALSQASVYPATLVGEAVRIPGAAHVWFSHNHPSGTAKLSRADVFLNSTLDNVFRGSGIEPMGLLAIAGDDYRYVLGNDIVSDGGTIQPASSNGATVPVIERQLTRSTVAQRPELTSPQASRAAAEVYYKASGGKPGMILLDAQHRVNAWVPLAANMTGMLRDSGGLRAIYRAVSEANAGAVVFVHGGELDADLKGGVSVGQNIGAALRALEVRVLDSINAKTGESAAEKGRELAGGPVYSIDDAAGPLPASEQVSVEVATEEVERLLDQFATEIPVVVLDRLSDLPDVAPPDGGVASGLLHKGRIHLIREGLGGRSAVVRTLWHELLHFGLRRFLTREEYIRTMGELFAADGWIRQQARAWEASAEGKALAAKESADYVRARAVDEALARLAEILGTNPSGYQNNGLRARAVRAVREWVAALAERFGFDAAARAWRGYAAQDGARDLVRSVFSKLRNGEQPAFTVGKTWEYSDPAFQVAWHGTPHRGIEKFDTDKIGTGEGAQVYGWGLYFASKKDVAEHYRKMLSRIGPGSLEYVLGVRQDEADALWIAASVASGDVASDISPDIFAFARAPSLRELEPSALRELVRRATEIYEAPRGQLYEVHVPENDELLDWDKPLVEQPAKVKAALDTLGVTARSYRVISPSGEEVASYGTLAAARAAIKRGNVAGRIESTERRGPIGRVVYEQLSDERGGDRAASEALAKAGIPGLRYLDGNSRASGEGSHNYVIFSGDDVAIERTHYSQRASGAQGATREALRAALEAEFGADVIDALEKAGLLMVANVPPPSMPARAAGATRGDNISLFAANTPAGSTAVAYHEALHAVLRRTIGDAAFDALMKRMPLLAAGNSKWFAEAADRIPANTSKDARNEELATYAVEQYQLAREAMPVGVRKWVQDLIAAIKVGLGKALQAAGVGLRLRLRLLSDASVLHKLARDGLRAMAREAQSAAAVGDRLAPTAFSLGPDSFATTERAYGGREAWQAAKDAGRTKLTYGQWVTVRTPQFKAWFGDWEADPGGDGVSKVVDPDTGEPMVVYHGTQSDFTEFVSHSPQRVMRQDGKELRRADSWDMGDARDGAPDAYHYIALSDAEFHSPVEALRTRERELRELQERNPGETFHDSERIVRDLRRLAAGGPVTKTIENRPSGVRPYFTPDMGYSFIANAGGWAETIRDGGNVMPVYLAIKNPVYLDAGAIESAGWAWEKYAEQGYDSAIFAGNKNDLTQRDMMGGSVQLVAFDSTQIKSATGNVGTFDAANPDIRYSIAEQAREGRRGSLNRATRERITDLLNRDTSLSWFKEVLGYPYALAHAKDKGGAPKYPGFKAVYDRAQQYLADINTFANDPANLAPDVVPQLERFRDLMPRAIGGAARQLRLVRADRERLAQATYEGTLLYRRDAWGLPVLARDDEPAGIVWDERELRGRYGFNDRQVMLYEQTRAAVDRSLDLLVAGEVARHMGNDLADDVRELVSDGDTAGFEAMVNAVLARAVNEAETELRTLHADLKAQESNAKLIKPIDAQDAGRAQKRIDAAQSAVRAAQAERDRLVKLQDDVGEKYEKVARLKAAGYFPLMRFGTEKVTVRDAQGKVLFFGLYESKAEANVAARWFRQAPGFEGTVRRGELSTEKFRLFRGVTPETLALFGDALGTDGERRAILDKYLQLTKANHSALRRLIRRKGTAGYSEDVQRTLAAFLTSNARAGSTALHAGAIGRAAHAIDAHGETGRGKLADYATRFADYVQNPGHESQGLRGLLFIQFIGGSVASAVVNLTQTPAQTYPFIASESNPKDAARIVGAAMRDALLRPDANSDLGRAIAHAEADGIISPQALHELQGQALNKLGGAESLLRAMGLSTAASAKLESAWRRGLFAWGGFFSLAEQYNRRVAFIAGYRLAVEQGAADPIAFAEAAVNETQNVYNRGNRPQAGRGPVGALVMTFSQFKINYIEFLTRLPARHAGVALLMLALLSGLEGLPFSDDLDDLIDTLMQRLFGRAWSTKLERKKLLASVFGPETAEWILHGATAVPGFPVDMAGRLSLGNMIPGTGVLLQSSRGNAGEVLEALGPAGGVVRDVIGGELRPLAARNLGKGLTAARTGEFRDDAGRKVMDATIGQAAAKAIGFNPQHLARAGRDRGMVMRVIEQQRAVERAIVRGIAQGIVDDDPQQVETARAKIDEWNRKNQQWPIVVTRQQIVATVRQMRSEREDRFMKAAPRELRSTVGEAMGAR